MSTSAPKRRVIQQQGKTRTAVAKKKETPKRLYDLAVELRTKGDIAAAEETLRNAAAKVLAKEEAGPWGKVAAADLSLLLLQQQRPDEADPILAELGFQYKLSPDAFGGKLGQQPGVPDVAATYDNVMPSELLQRLQQAFAPESPFWGEHGYPTDSFFSYNVPLQEGKDDEATTKLIREAADFIVPLAEKSFPSFFKTKEPKKVASVEWWAHSRNISGGGHQLHYDLDEAGLASVPEGQEPGHPLVSCVLYLSSSSSMPPTLVTDQHLEPDSVASTAWLCRPSENRLLMFNSRFLHGVVPNMNVGESDSSSGKSSRLTLMFGLWGDSPAPTLTSYRGKNHLGPNMVVPKADEHGITWPRVASVAAAAAVPNTAKGARPATFEGPISPVWLKVPNAKPPSTDVQFVGRWFLQHEPQKLQQSLIAEARAQAARAAELESKDEEMEEVEEMSIEELLRLRGSS